jgi:hypothetical protein
LGVDRPPCDDWVDVLERLVDFDPDLIAWNSSLRAAMFVEGRRVLG